MGRYLTAQDIRDTAAKLTGAKILTEEEQEQIVEAAIKALSYPLEEILQKELDWEHIT